MKDPERPLDPPEPIEHREQSYDEARQSKIDEKAIADALVKAIPDIMGMLK